MMLLFLPAALFYLLLRPALVMASAEAACALFVHSVLPGLFPYMVLSLMLVSRLSHRISPRLLMLLGWCGGSPTGARLMALCPAMPHREQIRLAVTVSTMSPMYLLGTLGSWLHAPGAGLAILASVLLGGWLTGCLAGRLTPDAASLQPVSAAVSLSTAALSLGQAVEQAARTMLLVCGTMVMLRVAASLETEALPSLSLPIATLLEVTTGTQALAALSLPLPWKTALLASATGFGGLAVLMQNRAVWSKGLMPLWQQLLWQALHGVLSGVLALGIMWMAAR